nr:type II toxin-antitoxin system ParD family antitoxin [uncultured Flavobacterium sp.]
MFLEKLSLLQLPYLKNYSSNLSQKNQKKTTLIPIIGIFGKKKNMARNTSILLGDYFENFINEQIATGKYSSVSEVVRTALRVFEQEEIKTKSLINELKIGEKSTKIKDFDRNKNLEMLKTNFQK